MASQGSIALVVIGRAPDWMMRPSTFPVIRASKGASDRLFVGLIIGIAKLSLNCVLQLVFYEGIYLAGSLAILTKWENGLFVA